VTAATSGGPESGHQIENDQTPRAGSPLAAEARIGVRGRCAVALGLWNAENGLARPKPRSGRKKEALPKQGPVAW